MSNTRSSSMRGKNQNSNGEEKIDDAHILNEIRSINKKLEKLLSLENKINNIEETIKGIVNSQSFLSEQYEIQKNTLLDLEHKIKNVEKGNLLKTQNISLKNQLDKVSCDYVDLEQYGRREMLEIGNVPRVTRENTDDIVLDIARAVEAKIQLDDIEISHRLSNKPDAGIIVKFNNRRKRNDFFFKARKKFLTHSDIGLNGEDKVYVNESLNGHYKMLLRKCKEIFCPAFKYIWTKNGCIFLRQNDGSRVFKVTTEKDIDKVQVIPDENGDNLNGE